MLHNTLIGETVLDLRRHFRRALRSKDAAISCLDTDEAVVGARRFAKQRLQARRRELALADRDRDAGAGAGEGERRGRKLKSVLASALSERRRLRRARRAKSPSPSPADGAPLPDVGFVDLAKVMSDQVKIAMPAGAGAGAAAGAGAGAGNFAALATAAGVGASAGAGTGAGAGAGAGAAAAPGASGAAAAAAARLGPNVEWVVFPRHAQYLPFFSAAHAADVGPAAAAAAAAAAAPPAPKRARRGAGGRNEDDGGGGDGDGGGDDDAAADADGAAAAATAVAVGADAPPLPAGFEGEVLISIELVPKSVAARFRAGLGRSKPNEFPRLPPPRGRESQLSLLNPFSALSSVMGRRALLAFGASMAAGTLSAAAVFGLPFVSSVVSLASAMPRGAAEVLIGVVGALVLVLLVWCCCCQCCRRARRVVELDLFGSAADILSGEGEGAADDDLNGEGIDDDGAGTGGAGAGDRRGGGPKA